jgi:hypothetical protein
VIGIIASLVWQTGCASHARRIAAPRNAFFQDQLEIASVEFEKIDSRSERDVIQLDLAMVDLFSGDLQSAETRLRQVRDNFDDAEGASIAETAVSLWADNRVKTYSGEDYEKVFVRTMLSLTSLLRDGSDAESYALQVNAKQRQLADRALEKYGQKFASHYQPLPIGFFLSGMLREATWRDYDEAALAYSKAADALPDSVLVQSALARAQHGVPCSPNNGVVYVIALVGRGPIKIETVEAATSDALLIADRIVSSVGDHSIPPTLAPIKLPSIFTPVRTIEAVGIDVDGLPAGQTEMVTNFSQIAVDTFEAKRTAIMAETIARRVVKKATVYAAKDSMQVDGFASLAMDLAGSAWEATEVADTRCWGLLPREIQIQRLELPVGTHALTLKPTINGHASGANLYTQLDVVDGQNHYALCYFPDAKAVGKCLIGPTR